MSLFFTVLFAFVTSFATPNLFDHATKNYTDYLVNQSPEKAKTAQTITNAVKLIKEIEQTEEKDSEDTHDVECDEKTFDELRLICAKKGAPLLEKINPKTAVGLAQLIKLVTQPTTNTEELKKRQKIITFFIEHPDITAKIQELLIDLKKEEDFLLSPYKNYTFTNKVQTIGTFFFLSAMNIFQLYFNLFFDSFNYRTNIDTCMEMSLLRVTQEQRESLAPFLQPVKAFFKFENMKELLQTIKQEDFIMRIGIFGLSLAPLIFFAKYLWTIENTVFSAKNFIINNPLKAYITEIFTLSDRLKNQNSFFKMIETLQKVQPCIPYTFYSLNANKSFLTKITSLNTSNGILIPFSKSFFTQERISTELHPHGDFLKKLYFDIGLLDACCSLAQFYRKFNGQSAQYVDPTNPIIDIKGGLHPNISGHSQSVTNDFLHTPHCGKPVTICSGKNGSGKSFNTKMILLTAWMAQTFGFTLTEKPCIITPFNYFKVHANISDSDYYSKFETEKNELGQLLEKVTALEQNKKKSLVFFDEPLSTTSSTLAEPLLNTLISMLKNNQYSLAFIITHLHAILANKDARQMSIKVIPNNDGTFTSTRKFQEGPSYDNDAAQLLAQTLNPSLRALFLQNYETEVKKIKARDDSAQGKDDTKTVNVIADNDKN